MNKTLKNTLYTNMKDLSSLKGKQFSKEQAQTLVDFFEESDNALIYLNNILNAKCEKITSNFPSYLASYICGRIEKGQNSTIADLYFFGALKLKLYKYNYEYEPLFGLTNLQNKIIEMVRLKDSGIKPIDVMESINKNIKLYNTPEDLLAALEKNSDETKLERDIKNGNANIPLSPQARKKYAQPINNFLEESYQAHLKTPAYCYLYIIELSRENAENEHVVLYIGQGTANRALDRSHRNIVMQEILQMEDIAARLVDTHTYIFKKGSQIVMPIIEKLQILNFKEQGYYLCNNIHYDLINGEVMKDDDILTKALSDNNANRYDLRDFKIYNFSLDKCLRLDSKYKKFFNKLID